MRVDDPRLEDRLGSFEPPYKSRGEAQVGRLLDRYGIPFFYELGTLVYDRGRYRTWHPDFTVMHYGGLVIEYAGMPDKPDYMDGIRHKERVYTDNAIPAVFVYPSDLQGPQWPAELLGRIEQAGSYRGAAESALPIPRSGQIQRLPYSRPYYAGR